MVSKDKQVLLDDIATQAERIAEQAAELRKLRTENAAHERRERERMRIDHRRKQEERRQAEQKARRDRINDLAAGKLDIGRATDWGIVHEDGRTGIQVFVPLDGEEQRVALGFLRREKVISVDITPDTDAFKRALRQLADIPWYPPLRVDCFTR